MERQLRELIRVNRAIAGTLQYEEALRVIVEKTGELLAADACLLMLDRGDGSAELAAAHGVANEAADGFVAPLDEMLEAALHDLVEPAEDDRFHAVPVMAGTRVLGVLAVYVRGGGPVTDGERFILDALADQAALALANADDYGAVQNEVAHKSHLLEVIQEATDSGLALFDEDLCLVEANAAFFRAAGLAEGSGAEGRRADELLPQGPLRATVDAAGAAGRRFSTGEVMGADKSYWDWYAQPVGHTGRARGVVVTAVDVTSKVRARERLEEGARRKNEFLAMLGHELRNPLAAVVNALHILEQTGANDGPAGQALEIATRQSRQMKRLLDDLLDVSRVVRGKVELDHGRINMGEICRQAARAIEPSAADKRQTLEVSTAEAWVRGDEGRLAQVLSNLLTNAVKYTAEGGTIQLSCARHNGEVVVRVRDSGSGISPEDLPHIFELFSQASQRLDRSDGGLGIGLAVAWDLVRMHGGRIEAHSEGRDTGTEMTVRLPVVSAGAPIEEGGKDQAREQPGRRVLLVEDNEDEARILSAALELAGHEVLTAANGLQGVERALRMQPDVVVLDIGLPGMDGFEVARILRAKMGDRVRLIAVSGYDPSRVEGEAKLDHRLIKPVDARRLHDLIVKNDE